MSDEGQTPVYFIAHFEVTDADTYRNYEKGFFPIFRKYGGEFITLDDSVETFEGEREAGRTVLFQFPSEEAGRSWYADPEYQELCKFRWEGTQIRSLVMVHGMAPRG
ncbi:MAG: DUF1330 domain-containing protein [Acidimicrobiales bacterium]